MKHSVFLKIRMLSHIVTALFLLSLPLANTYAKAGCCAAHGGVAGCNAASSHQRCKDGTDSVSCLCDGSSVSKSVKSTKALKVKPVEAKKSIKVKPAEAKKSIKKKAKTKSAISKKSPKTTGCCRGHGGVAQCNKTTGYQKCKDGTMSASCKC